MTAISVPRLARTTHLSDNLRVLRASMTDRSRNSISQWNFTR